ncbi:MAG TPA: PEP/pyruvate-binding domain-containing protein, partial [Chitinophagaceae bacterium]|nr:PEP/pyruvate-binding domain-containing protein [Chitinophagaceae bacterium]
MNSYVLGFREIDKTKLMLAGGKGANLGELSLIEGIRVPDGFCVTTTAFKKITTGNKEFIALVDELTHLKPTDRKKINEVSTKIRLLIESIPVSKDIENEIDSYLKKIGEQDAYAVRSSATAEDLPSASFAGQQDSYLNITGTKNILTHISKCWASLFTERAVTYRIQNGFDHHKVYLAVVIQKMIFPDVSGILFTADPVTSNRKIVSIDASFGLGEALVSGIVNADVYKVRNRGIIDKKIAVKKLAIHALKEGGTKEQPIETTQQNIQALTDEQILQLEQVGRKIEAHFNSPQDIEWCLTDNKIYIVQSRPITTLFPIPKENDNENHVYLSTGHQQMMTDPIKPLGISFWQLLAARPMSVAGGRFFVDVAGMLAAPATRDMLLNMMAKSDPLSKDAITTILDRGDFIKSLPADDTGKHKTTAPPPNFAALVDIDPVVVEGLVNKFETSVNTLKQDIQAKSGSEVFDYIRDNTQQLKKILSDPKS